MNKSYQSSQTKQAFPNLTNTENKAFLCINRNLNINLTIEKIAETIGVGERQGKRVVKTLASLGLITISKAKGQWNPINRYGITAEGKRWYHYFINKYKVDTGIFVRPMLSITLLLSMSSSCVTLLREDYVYNHPNLRELQTRARENEHRSGLIRKKPGPKGIVCMKPEQMKWIRSHRNDPRVKEMMTNEKITSQLFTPEMLKIAEILQLNERKRLKMISFPREAAKYALECIAPVVSGQRRSKKPIDDKMGWMMSIFISFCNKNNVKPDWSWYNDIADITGLRYIESDNNKEPLITLTTKPNPMVKKNHGYSSYDAWVSPALPPVEERVAKIKASIAGFEKQLGKPEDFWDPRGILFDSHIGMTRNLLGRAQQELAELERPSHEEAMADR